MPAPPSPWARSAASCKRPAAAKPKGTEKMKKAALAAFFCYVYICRKAAVFLARGRNPVAGDALQMLGGAQEELDALGHCFLCLKLLRQLAEAFGGQGAAAGTIG